MTTSDKGSISMLAACACCIAIAGCASGFTTIAPVPPAHYEKLGHARGEATGSIGLGPTSLNFIPLGLNSRVQNAYDNALQSVPGATGLIDVTYQESWFWWVLGSARKVTISGEAIKELPQ